MEILVVIISWLLFGGASSYFARQRGRDPFAWFLIGMFLGILGLLLLFLLPPLAPVVPAADVESEEPVESEDVELEETELPNRLKAWYYLDLMRNQVGPVSYNQLKKADVQADTLVWCEGMPEWKTVAEIPELKESLLYDL